MIFNGKKKRMPKSGHSTTRMIAFGFALIIVIGTILLSLPIATKTGETDLLTA